MKSFSLLLCFVLLNLSQSSAYPVDNTNPTSEIAVPSFLSAIFPKVKSEKNFEDRPKSKLKHSISEPGMKEEFHDFLTDIEQQHRQRNIKNKLDLLSNEVYSVHVGDKGLVDIKQTKIKAQTNAPKTS